ncbi:hypothetical protein ACSBR2_028923 [Camellia fascicularis]
MLKFLSKVRIEFNALDPRTAACMEQMFRDAGEQWPVIIPEEEIRQAAPGTKDLSSKRIFGKGYERDKLYYFRDPPDEEKVAKVKIDNMEKQNSI